MSTEGSIVEAKKEDYRFSAKMFLVVVILQMIACEAETIHGLWFKESTRDYGLNRYFLPVFIAFPALMLLIVRLRAKRWVAPVDIVSGPSARLMNIFGAVLMITYIGILQLAEIAFNSR